MMHDVSISYVTNEHVLTRFGGKLQRKNILKLKITNDSLHETFNYMR
jgi:hypothetical protein